MRRNYGWKKKGGKIHEFNCKRSACLPSHRQHEQQIPFLTRTRYTKHAILDTQAPPTPSDTHNQTPSSSGRSPRAARNSPRGRPQNQRPSSTAAGTWRQSARTH
ncbi:hypothetical protein EYC84_008460 [Monilinia fructicola]|uniref:Uncharacterized protein n=1 Tax=Monilinia fructicola TaxID=38448 RepID=A0A5M9JFE9_MONFR|nr:hypothetical protein EYC84_008460 [Monilinia fructicola]